MSKVLQFPGRHHRTPPAALSSTFDRAASKTNVIEVTPASRARFVRKTGSHHCGGIQSRCHHLVTLTGSLPMSDASATRDEPHSSIIPRKVPIRGSKGPRRARSERDDLILGLTESRLGQTVLTHKVNLYRETTPRAVNNTVMGKQSSSEYKAEFTARVKKARIDAGYSQADISELLDIDQGKYKQYEGRSFMPHHLVPRFCLLTQVDPGWLFTGTRRGLRRDTEPQTHRPSRPSRKDRAA